MGEILTGNRNRKTKKMVGVLIGLSLVQTGMILVPGGNLTMTVFAGDEMTTEEYAQAAEAALAQLSAGSDKSVLNDLISQVQNLDTSSSDEASVAQLQAVLASASQVSGNANASQSIVDKHIQLLTAVGKALYEKTDANTVYDGVYEISGSLQHASADQVSMGNAALQKPFQLIKDGDSLKLRIECTPLTTKLGSTNFTGYLAEFWYFPDWTDEVLPPSATTSVQSADTETAAAVSVEESEDTEEAGNTEADTDEADVAEMEDVFSDGGSGEEASAANADQGSEQVALYAGNVGGIAADVESQYDGVYDSYNDPKKGTDANVKGKLYPHYITIPIDLNRTLLWTQVYVPVMEAIGGGGRQYARLVLEWSSLRQISGTTTDKSALTSGISEAESLLASLNADNQGFTGEEIQALTQVIATAKAVNTNINVNQDIVNNETNVLTTAVNLFTKPAVADKSELKKALEVADTYLNADDVVYDPATLATLQEARDKAQEVWDDEEASQTQVNLCVTAIDNAIQGLVITGGDRRELKKVMNTAAEILKDEDSYSAADHKRLQSAYNKAKSVLENEDAEQSEIDECVENLNYVMKNMKKTTEVKVDKSSLYEMLKTAQNMSGREDLYTANSIKSLKSAITAAEKVYQNDDAAQSDVNAQTSALSTAIMNLTVKPSNSNSSSNNSNNSGSTNTDNSGSLDINNLADGVYSVTGSMVKTDKTTASMSNEAINHTIKLTVKNGKYKLTMDFKGMTINSQFGYLGKLKYFKTGYTLDKYGSPKGALGNVTINSYQKYSDGRKVSDNFGSNYPDVVTFPMISEALKDGYVPLQVFVPIMDSISKGTGTQPVFLKLDWSTIKKTSSNDSSFKDTSSNDNTDSGSGTSGTTGTTGTTGSLGGNTLKTNSSLGTNSSLSTNSSLGGSSLKSSGTSSLKSSAKTSLTSGTNVKSSKSGDTKTTALTSTAKSESAGTDGAVSTGSGTASASSSKSAEDVGKVVIPSVLSSLAALAGIFYKLKSRLGGH